MFKRLEKIVIPLSFILSLLLILTLFSSLSMDDIKHYFNSDTLYLPSIYHDLFIDHNGLRGWHFNPSPNFFPDMIIYFVLMFISGNLIISSFLFTIAQYLVLMFLIPFLFRIIMPQVSNLFISISVLLMTLFFFVTFFSHDFVFTFYLISNAYHTGTFVIGLICLVLTMNHLIAPLKRNLTLLFFLCFLSVLSDRLFIVLYSVPVCTIAFFLIKRKYSKEVHRILLINVISVITGLALFMFIDQSHYVFIDKANSLMNMANIGSSFKLLFAQLFEYLMGLDFKSLIILLSMISFTGMIFIFFRRREKQDHNLFLRFYCLFSVSYFLIVLFMPVLAGNYTGYDTLRYNIYIFYFGIINTGILLAVYLTNHMTKRSIRMIVSLLPVAFSIIVAITIITEFSSKGLIQFFTYYPNMVKCMDDAVQKDKLLYGVGGYWDAKYITLFSKKNVRIYPVYDDLTPCNHVTNENWYTDKNATFNFIIQNHMVDSLAYRSKLGLTGERINSCEPQLIKVPPFKYNPKDNTIYWAK